MPDLGTPLTAEDRKNSDGYGAAGGEDDTPDSSVRRVRLTFGLFFLAGYVLALLLRNDYAQWITKWAVDHNGCTSHDCIGTQGVYRVSFALFLFFAFHLLMSCKYNLCLSTQGRIKFNHSGFLFKLIGLVPLVLISFAIPNGFFVVFAWISLIVAAFFLVAQMLILIEFAYSWSDAWVSQEEQRFQVGLLICTGLMFGGALTMDGLMYKWYGAASACQENQAFISITLIFGVLYSVMSGFIEHGTILASAAVMLYTSWTCFSAISATPHGECSTLHANPTTQIIVGSLVTGISLGYTAVNAGTSRGAFQLSDDEEESEEDAVASGFTFFHFVMMMASCYLAMLCSDWKVLGNDHMASLDTTNGPLWAKISSEWVCILLYMFTLAAPYVFEDRSFS